VNRPALKARIEAIHPIPPFATGVEIMVVYAGILLYIWRWQYTHPYAWTALFPVVILSHVIYRDTLREMGLTGNEFKACARLIFPLFIAIAVPGVIYGLWKQSWAVLPFAHAWLSFGGYAIWCSFQQYLMHHTFTAGCDASLKLHFSVRWR